MNEFQRLKTVFLILRIYLALTMVIHGAARIYAGGVAPFGEFLDGRDLPFGFWLALAVTLFEIGGGIALVFGGFVRVIALIFAAQLICGIVLVHAPQGWFVVGLGRNGMEYSVLLVISFLCAAFVGSDKTEAAEILLTENES